VVVFAVDDRGVVFALVLFDGVPHLRDPGAGGIDNGATLVVEQLHLLHAGPKGGENDHVALADPGKIFITVDDFDKLHRHIFEALVDAGVVDDFVGDPNALGGEVLAGFVGHGNGPLNPPAKTKRLSQLDGDIAPGEGVAAIANLLNQTAVVLGLHLARDLFPVAKPWRKYLSEWFRERLKALVSIEYSPSAAQYLG
jgi:hypothetical protein